jgi:tetratricopeptide (TPR) repeat protein
VSMMSASIDRDRPYRRVFISYAHESDEHDELVRDLWLYLRSCGIDAKLDLPAAERRQDWPLWMADQVRQAEHILVIASPAYRRRAEGRAGSEEGRGVQWEARLIRDAFYANQHDLDRFVPVVLPGQSPGGMPDFLAPSSNTVYTVRDFTESGAESLLRLLTRQPREVEPPLGSVPNLPAREHTPPGQVLSSASDKTAEQCDTSISNQAFGPAGALVQAGAIGSVHLPPPRGPEPALHGPPRKSGVFAGRKDELDELLRLLEPGSGTDRLPVVGVVTGLPGVGKTELVVQAAHAALANGWFPGGVLFLDVLGYSQEQPMTANAALDVMLRMIGIAAEDIPAGEYRARLFTSRLTHAAAMGKPILVVIDNVASREIAEALVPAAGTTLVTSRGAMAGFGARRFELKELSEAAAVQMLDGELRAEHETDTRATEQYQEALSITRLCGELPLALHMVAALLAADTTRPLSTMARDLHDADTRLDEMHYPEDTQGERGVRAAFDLSFRRLSDEQARLLQLFPLNIGPEISTEAIAAMAELDVGAARQGLAALQSTHLIRAGASYGQHGRWRMHDLIRIYVSKLPFRQDNMHVALLLLLLYYCKTAAAATRWLDPTAARRGDSPFTNREEALEWLDTEYSNFSPYGHVFPIYPEPVRTTTIDLILGLWRYFELRRRTDDWVNFTTNALTMARVLGDRGREGDALTKLGGAYRQARRFDDAVDACRKAITIQDERGDQHAKGIALNNLAAALLEAKRYDEALTVAQEAVGVFEETGDRYRMGIAFSQLGGALTGIGRPTEGVSAYEKAFRIFHEAGDLRGAGGVQSSLGNALRLSGTVPEQSIELNQQAVTAMAASDDCHGKGIALTNLSASLFHAGRLDEAIAAAQEAVGLFRDTDDSHRLGAALVNLGTALQNTGRATEAVAILTDAVTTYQHSGDQDAEASTRLSLGEVLAETGGLQAAITTFRVAVDMCHKANDRRGEGRALGRLGQALWQAKQSTEALNTLRSAVTVSRAAGDIQSETATLAFLGHVAGVLGHQDEAISALRDASELCRRAGNEELAEQALRALRASENAKHLRDKIGARLAAGRFEEVIADYRETVWQITNRHGGLAHGLDELRDHIVGGLAAQLGRSLSRVGRVGQAISILDEAVAAFREASDQDQEQAARFELDSAQEAQFDAHTAAEELGRLLSLANVDSQLLQTAIDDAGRHLGLHDARFLRLLSANPGPSISLPAAAVLAVTDPAIVASRLKELSNLATDRQQQRLFFRIRSLYQDDMKIARGALDTLTQMRLVEQDPIDQQRWRLPTAIRLYAAKQGRKHGKKDQRKLIQKLLHLYYLAGAQNASAPLDAGPVAPNFHEPQKQGIYWLTTEYLNLVGTVRDATDDDLGAVIAVNLTSSLRHIMDLTRRVDDAIELNSIAVLAARRLHDRPAEADILRSLGGILIMTGQHDQAISTLREALAIYRELEDSHGQGATLTTLGIALTHSGRYDEADAVLRPAIDIHRQSGRGFSEAVALSSLGTLLAKTGQPEGAVAAYHDADRIFRKIGDQHHRAMNLTQLADVLHNTERGDEAVKTYQRAARLAQVTGDRLLASVVLNGLARARHTAGPQVDADSVVHNIAQLVPDTDDTPRGKATPR